MRPRHVLTRPGRTSFTTKWDGTLGPSGCHGRSGLELSLGHYAAVDAVLGPLSVMVGDMSAADPALVVFLPDEIEALDRPRPLRRPRSICLTRSSVSPVLWAGRGPLRPRPAVRGSCARQRETWTGRWSPWRKRPASTSTSSCRSNAPALCLSSAPATAAKTKTTSA